MLAGVEGRICVQVYHCRIDDTTHQLFPTSSCLMTHLEDIDVISLQPLAAILDSSEDPLSYQYVSKAKL